MIGTAVIVVGAVLIGIDQDPIAKPPGQQQPEYYYDTAVPGIAVSVTGAVVAGIGGYLWWRYSESSSTPTISVANGGAVFGLARAF